MNASLRIVAKTLSILNVLDLINSYEDSARLLSIAAVVNVGTSAQLILPLSSKHPHGHLPPGLVSAPYFGGDSIAVAASLNGGNVLSHFVAMLHSWLHDLGVSASSQAAGDAEESLWGRLSALALAEAETVKAPVVNGRLFGERHATGGGAEVVGIEPGPGLRLGAVFGAICLGVMRNLREMAAEVMTMR